MAPHFFNIVLLPIDHGVKIPNAFMREYGNELQKTVILRVPNGDSWQVQLVNCDNRTWLRKGWQEFAEYYSIKKFHFLVFRYDGNSQFYVLIFDPSASEIEYPFGAGTTQQVEDVSVQILRKIPTTEGSKRERPATDLQESVEILDDDDTQAMCRNRMTRCSHRMMAQKKKGRTRSGSHSQSNISGRRSLRDKEKFISYQNAKAFRSTKPFFISFMHSSYVSGIYILGIPLWFVKNYLSCRGKRLDLVLRVGEGGQTWSAICSTNHRSGTANIIVGWKKFVEDNNLKMSDACVFELESGTNVFNIIIYRTIN